MKEKEYTKEKLVTTEDKQSSLREAPMETEREGWTGVKKNLAPGSSWSDGGGGGAECWRQGKDVTFLPKSALNSSGATLRFVTRRHRCSPAPNAVSKGRERSRGIGGRVKAEAVAFA